MRSGPILGAGFSRVKGRLGRPRLSSVFAGLLAYWLMVGVAWPDMPEGAGGLSPIPRAAGIAPISDRDPIPLAAWMHPPDEARPLARWWWPGGSVKRPLLKAQLEAIRAAGFGGVELQPLLLGLGSDDLAADPQLRTVGEPSFFEHVAAAAASAAEQELAFDLTLGSGWPGGLPTPVRNAERQLLMATLDLTGPAEFSGPLPSAPGQSYRNAVEWVLDVLGAPDTKLRRVAVMAGQLGPESQGVPTLGEVLLLDEAVEAGRLKWRVPPGAWRVFVLYANSTSHFVMGGAYPGEESAARVVDHLSRRGADALIQGYGDPAMKGLAPGQVRGVFVDSFELMGELPFSEDFLAAFKAHTGYSLTPHLPLLFRQGGESKYAEMVDILGRNGGPLYVSPRLEDGERIREDYEEVRRLLFEGAFVARFAEWAEHRGIEFRLQAHGGYGNYLDTYALADVPESEGLFAGGRFDFLKLAASAAHVKGGRWASSESFITLRLLGTRLSWPEMRLLAGRAYSAGINRLVFHGVPYPYVRADGEAWYPFSGGFGRILAGPLPMSSEIDAEFLAGLPELNAFLSRLSVAMSQGEPVAEIAWLMSEPTFPDTASIEFGRVDPKSGESVTTGALRARGLVHDRISRRMLEAAEVGPGEFRVGARSYRGLVLDPLAIAEPELVIRVAELAAAGIPVIALGSLPVRAPGRRDAMSRDSKVRAATAALETRVRRPGAEASLEKHLLRAIRPGLVEPMPGESLSVSLDRRRTPSGEILLVFNESWSGTTAKLRFTQRGGRLFLWDPFTGSRRLLRTKVEVGESVTLELEAAGLQILTLEKPELSTP